MKEDYLSDFFHLNRLTVETTKKTLPLGKKK